MADVNFIRLSLPSFSAQNGCVCFITNPSVNFGRVLVGRTRVSPLKARTSSAGNGLSTLEPVVSIQLPGVNLEMGPQDFRVLEGVDTEGDQDEDNEEEDIEMNGERTEQVSNEEADVDREMELFEDMEMFVPPGAKISKDKPLRRIPCSNIYLGPYARDSRVKQAEFVKSSGGVEDCPDTKYPEFAMVGRSNAGKSSLINALVQRKSLAQTSKKPGKTQLINHFIINNSWYLVDLPGYGYAKVPVGVRASWNDFTKDYFLRSKGLVCVMLLVDASIPPQKNDLEYAGWLHENKVPLTVVFTKCDRKKKKKNGGKKPEENVKDFLRQLMHFVDPSPPWIMTSCVTNQGRDGLLMHMAQLRNYWKS